MTNSKSQVRPIKTSTLLALAAALALAAPATGAQTAAQTAAQAAYPTRVIQLVVPFPPGAGTDALARLVSPALGDALGGKVVVENKVGAAGNIGTEAVARAMPDGHTLLLGGIWLAVNPSLFKSMPYDPKKDFTSIALLANQPLTLVVNPGVKANSVKELVALAKSDPGKLTYGSAGIGNQPHLLAELFVRATGINVIHVPYKGAGAALNDVIAGHVTMLFLGPSSTKPHIDAGKVRGLAITGTERFAALPNLPTFDEVGFPIREFDNGSWWGLNAPAATPPAILERLNAAANKALQDPTTRERLIGVGFTPRGGAPSGYDRVIQSETATWSRLIQSAGIKPE